MIDHLTTQQQVNTSSVGQATGSTGRDVCVSNTGMYIKCSLTQTLQ